MFNYVLLIALVHLNKKVKLRIRRDETETM